jgi:serine/threonine protein kinase
MFIKLQISEKLRNNKHLNTLRGTELYMSPILFTTLRNTNKNNVNHNIYKSDVFSLGYCILYAATLSFQILYDLRHVNNSKQSNTIIKTCLNKKYSSKFIDIVCKIVDVNEENRYDFIELNKELKENFSYL